MRVGWARLNKKAAVAVPSAEQRANAVDFAAFLATFGDVEAGLYANDGSVAKSDEASKSAETAAVAVAADEDTADTAKKPAEAQPTTTAEDAPAVPAEEEGEKEAAAVDEEAKNEGNVKEEANDNDDNAAAADASGIGSLPKTASSKPTIRTAEGTPLAALLRCSNAAWVEFQDSIRARLLAENEAAIAEAAAAAAAAPRASYLPSSFGKDGGASASVGASAAAAKGSSQEHVAGPLALARVHSRAHQSKERPMVILREFGAPRMLNDASDHIRYNRTVLQLTTAVDPLMNFEVLNGHGVYCDAPMYALPFEDERAVYTAVSQFGEISGITFTPDRRSVFVTFARPQSVAAAVARARQANWLEGGVRASALGHSTQGK